MFYRQSTMAYGIATAEGTTQAGLLQLVYSRLAQDLMRAAAAITQGHIEDRCAASNHAFLLLGHLESWAHDAEEPELTKSLLSFYQFLRNSILQQQAVPDGAALEQLALLVLETGGAWKTKEELMGAACRRESAESGTPEERVSFLA